MRVLADLSTLGWSLLAEPVGGTAEVIEVAFTDGPSDVTVFDDLSCGLSIPGILDVAFPPEGVRYQLTDHQFLEAVTVNGLVPDTEYELTAWALNGGQRFQHVFTFVQPRPEAPFPSWLWEPVDCYWYPPVPYPDDDTVPYEWDESVGNWVPVE